jgi:hypothetical protein
VKYNVKRSKGGLLEMVIKDEAEDSQTLLSNCTPHLRRRIKPIILRC